MDKTGTAVVGLGGNGQRHAHLYDAMDETELVAVCDVIPEVAEEVAEYAGHHYKESDFDWTNRWWHADRARGHFKECMPRPQLPGATICLTSNFSPRIYKWQYGDGDRREETE